MGDYYKYKKILVILMIISCGFSIIKNIFKNNVNAAEDVNSSIQSGNYVVQTDNHYETLSNLMRDWQTIYCSQILERLSDDSTRQETITSCKLLYSFLISKTTTVYFYIISPAAGFYVQLVPLNSISNSNITLSGFTWQDSYNFNNVPILQFSRNGSDKSAYYFQAGTGKLVQQFTSGTSPIMAIPCLGFLSPMWVNVFENAGIFKSPSEYQNVLSSIEQTLEQDYTANYYTKEAVQNTYSYITNGNTETITSSGISQPEVTEPDISDAFDSLSELLTNDNATTKAFTLTLPNGYQQAFSLSPDFLRNSLTRVGGGALVTIIETLWYIGLYGLMIFTILKVIGALMAGDLDSVTGVLSPVNSVVNSSLEATGAFRTAGGDTSAFRIRKG